jgi:hypothetical protein
MSVWSSSNPMQGVALSRCCYCALSLPQKFSFSFQIKPHLYFICLFDLTTATKEVK